MTKPTYTVTESRTTTFVITLPSGYLLKIEFGSSLVPVDIEFMERIVRLACEEGEKK